MKNLGCAFGVAENGRKAIVVNWSVMSKRTSSVRQIRLKFL